MIWFKSLPGHQQSWYHYLNMIHFVFQNMPNQPELSFEKWNFNWKINHSCINNTQVWCCRFYLIHISMFFFLGIVQISFQLRKKSFFINHRKKSVSRKLLSPLDPVPAEPVPVQPVAVEQNDEVAAEPEPALLPAAVSDDEDAADQVSPHPLPVESYDEVATKTPAEDAAGEASL